MLIAIYFLLALILGVAAGIATGLTPGVHVNVIASLMVAAYSSASLDTDLALPIAIFIVAVSITHVFFDYIPSLFLGVPTSEVYALLPGHRMIKKGQGGVALRLSIEGSWRGLLLSFGIAVIFIILTLLGMNILSQAESLIRPFLFWILLSISIILITSEENKVWAAAIFLMSGVFGIIVLGTPLIAGGSQATFGVLFPALSGLFGVSGLLLSLAENTAKVPNQKNDISLCLKESEVNFAAVSGTLSGMFVGLLPGLGSANAAALMLLITNGYNNKNNENSYIITTSAIQASDALFGITALYFINRSRSGASVAIDSILSGISVIEVLVIIGAMIISGLISRIIILNTWTFFLNLINLLEYRSLTVSVVFFISALVFLTTGMWGLVILIASATLGLLPPIINVKRSQMMGFFLIPVILFFSGFQAEIVTSLSLQAQVSPPIPTSLATIFFQLLISLSLSFFVYFSFGFFSKSSN